MQIYSPHSDCLGAGYFPRHTNVFHNLDDAPMDIDGQVSYGRSPLHHADWGIRQWMPFLLGMFMYSFGCTQMKILFDFYFFICDEQICYWMGIP